MFSLHALNGSICFYTHRLLKEKFMPYDDPVAKSQNGGEQGKMGNKFIFFLNLDFESSGCFSGKNLWQILLSSECVGAGRTV